MALTKRRKGTDISFDMTLASTTATFDWEDVTILQMSMKSDVQRALDGELTYSIDATTSTILHLKWAADEQLYLGDHRLVGVVVINNVEATFDIPAVTIVATSDEADSGTSSITLTGATDVSGLTGTITVVGQGPKGEKGDPGSDAEVTKENIEAALGYTPVTPETVTAEETRAKAAEPFKAVYGKTTYDELYEACIEGKLIYLIYETEMYIGADYENGFTFTSLKKNFVGLIIQVSRSSVWSSKSVNLAKKTDLDNEISRAQAAEAAKQDTLVSGTNLKTINNQSLLGSGNITIEGGSGSTTWGSITGTLSYQTDLNTALTAKADASSTYTKTETDTKLAEKANDSEVVKVVAQSLDSNYQAQARANISAASASDLANKVDKVSGKDLSTNDFTDTYKSEVDTLWEDYQAALNLM